jgi:predicted kinase
MKPTLIITMGLVGTGKTTIAKALAKKLGLEYISSDITRKRLASIPETEHRYEGFDKGIYSPAFTFKTYKAMLGKAEWLLDGGKSVILDASFSLKIQRALARVLAQMIGADFYAVECVLDESVVRKRLADRKDTASDGRWKIYRKQKKVFEPVSELLLNEHIVVDTAKPIGEIMDGILEEVRVKC